MKKFTEAEITVLKVLHENLVKRLNENIILNFSGGIDSLAAKYIMPNNTKLVAIDFERGYVREKNFFKRFNPYVLQTNVRQELNVDRNSWEFMGIGAILYGDYLTAGYHVFGTILEASKANFSYQNNSGSNKTYPFICAGLKDIRYTCLLYTSPSPRD